MLDDTIRAGEWVMLKLPSGNSKIFVLKADERVELGKFGSFDSNNLIGRHQLVPYEVVGDGNIRPVENLDYLQEFDLGDTEEDASNMTIVDDPTSQRLTHQEIEELKSQSLEGKVDHSAVIQKIVQNNAAFEKKTDFAKAKYIQRKQRKFAKIFTPIKPTTRLFCDFYLAKKPEKTREMRIDTLSQIMTFANVRAGSRFLVVDDASGLIVGAMLERMHEHGKIFALHDKETPNFDLVRMLNFSDEVMSVVSSLPWFHLHELPPFVAPSHPDALDRAQARRNQLERTRDDILAGAFDGLVVASRFDPKEILIKLEPLLAPSKPLVVYSPTKESLLEAYNHVRLSRRFVNTQLTESWLREYQVPVFNSGTHPTMMTSGSGGYLFTATTVVDDGVRIEKAGAAPPGTGGQTMGMAKKRKVAGSGSAKDEAANSGADSTDAGACTADSDVAQTVADAANVGNSTME